MELRMSASERIADSDLTTIRSIVDLLVARNREIDALTRQLAEARHHIEELQRSSFARQAARAS